MDTAKDITTLTTAPMKTTTTTEITTAKTTATTDEDENISDLTGKHRVTIREVNKRMSFC